MGQMDGMDDLMELYGWGQVDEQVERILQMGCTDTSAGQIGWMDGMERWDGWMEWIDGTDGWNG